MVYKNFLLRCLFAVIILSIYFIISYIDFNLVFYLILLIYFIILLEIIIYFKTYKFIPIIYIALSLICFFNIDFKELKILDFNLLLIIIITFDIFSYFFGKAIGKTKLINISPKKTIEGLVGGIEKMNYGIEKCNSDLNIAASDISKKFKNTSQEEKKYYKIEVDAARSYPFTGKSSITSLSFNFLDGAKMILACYIMDKQAEQKESFLTSISNKKDTFRVDIRSHKFNNFLKKNK